MPGLSKAFKVRELKIPNGQDTTSASVNVSGWPGLELFFVDSAFTGANVSILVSDSPDGDFIPLYDGVGNLITITKPGVLPAVAGFTSSAQFRAGLSICFMKLKSASNEAAERTIRVLMSGDRP